MVAKTPSVEANEVCVEAKEASVEAKLVWVEAKDAAIVCNIEARLPLAIAVEVRMVVLVSEILVELIALTPKV